MSRFVTWIWNFLTKWLLLEKSPVKNIPTLKQLLQDRISHQLRTFPGYAQVRQIAVVKEPWTVENRLKTPTLKLRRKLLLERYSDLIESLYKGHTVVFRKAS
jgi:long-subunit acyl-CoA synthetase (AMP-forming)